MPGTAVAGSRPVAGARSVEVTYGPSKKCEKVQPSGVSMVSAAATARSPAPDQEAPAGQPGGGQARGGDPVENVDGQRQFRCGGAPARRAGRGTGLTHRGGGTEGGEDGAQGRRGGRGACSGMWVASHSTGAAARGGWGGRRCLLTEGRRGGGPGWCERECGSVCRPSTGTTGTPRKPGPRAPTLCLVDGVYTTRVRPVFRLSDSGRPGKVSFGRRYAEIIPISGPGPRR